MRASEPGDGVSYCLWPTHEAHAACTASSILQPRMCARRYSRHEYCIATELIEEAVFNHQVFCAFNVDSTAAIDAPVTAQQGSGSMKVRNVWRKVSGQSEVVYVSDKASRW